MALLRLRVNGIARPHHVALHLWSGARFLGGFCLLLHARGPRPESYPRLHVGVEWRGRLWDLFSDLGRRASR